MSGMLKNSMFKPWVTTTWNVTVQMSCTLLHVAFLYCIQNVMRKIPVRVFCRSHVKHAYSTGKRIYCRRFRSRSRTNQNQSNKSLLFAILVPVSASTKSLYFWVQFLCGKDTSSVICPSKWLIYKKLEKSCVKHAFTKLWTRVHIILLVGIM